MARINLDLLHPVCRGCPKLADPDCHTGRLPEGGCYGVGLHDLDHLNIKYPECKRGWQQQALDEWEAQYAVLMGRAYEASREAAKDIEALGQALQDMVAAMVRAERGHHETD